MRTSLDVEKQSFLFSGDLTWLPRDKGPLSTSVIVADCFAAKTFERQQRRDNIQK